MFTPQPTAYDVSFRLFGFPIRIHPLFWIIAVFLGSQGEIDNMRTWLIDIALWVAAVFIGIIVHELGHALVFRHVHHVGSSILLHGFGGATIPYHQHRRKPGLQGFFGEVFLDAAGVLAGFLLAGLLYFPVMQGAGGVVTKNPYVATFLFDLFLVCIVWGIFNLLPIYPLDGGHIAREFFCLVSPRSGIANSLVLSIFVAALIAVLWLRIGAVFNAMLFGYFAFLSYQQLSSRQRW